MSSYLTFYLVPKAEDSKPLDLISYSRNTNVYQYFDEVLHVAYIGNSDEKQYTELDTSKVDRVLEELKNDISKAQKRMAEYEKHANGNTEIIEEVISQKEYIEDLEWALHKVEFIRDIVVEATYSYCDYNKVLCNVD
jgi:hypothetical protein